MFAHGRMLVFSGIAAGFVLTGCASSPHAADEKYYLVATNIKLPYWQSALAGLNKAGAQLKVPVEFAGPDTYDPKAEQKELQSLIQRKPAPTGILISASDPLLAPDIEAAMRQGIPVVTIDSDLVSGPRLLFIGTDNYKAGTIGGELTAKLLQGKGNVVVMTIPEQPNLNQRLHGYQDVFSAHPSMKVTQVIDMKGDSNVAFDATKGILESKQKVDAIVCLEAIACPEVAEVVSREHQEGKVVIVAMDTDQRTLEDIQKGVIAATVGQKPFTMAYFGVMLLDQFHHYPLQPLIADRVNDSTSPIPAFVDTGATLIDKSNVASFLNQNKGGGT